MSHGGTADYTQSFERSQKFFSNPNSYSRVNSSLVCCIEPSDPVGYQHGEFPVTRQTPGGGGPGEGLDAAVVMVIDQGKLEAVPLPQALAADKARRPDSIAGAHFRCAYVGIMRTVVYGIANPSKFAMRTMTGWADQLNQQLSLRTLADVRDAAAVELDYIESHKDMEHLVHATDKLHEGADNVTHVHDKGPVGVYTLVFDAFQGPDRNKKPVDRQEASEVLSYCDTIGANVAAIERIRSIGSREREIRFSALLARSAVTMEAILASKPYEMVQYEVLPGLNITQRDYRSDYK